MADQMGHRKGQWLALSWGPPAWRGRQTIQPCLHRLGPVLRLLLHLLLQQLLLLLHPRSVHHLQLACRRWALRFWALVWQWPQLQDQGLQWLTRGLVSPS